MDKMLIAITGGIGAGKSVVAKVLKNIGYDVYDCDFEAKQLINTSPIIKKEFTCRFGNSIYNQEGIINKDILSSIIFNDHDVLRWVNSIVHPAVKDDIYNWLNSRKNCINFVETAILTEAGMQDMVNEVWNVTAPMETRISRVMKRNGITQDKVIERINAQSGILEGLNIPVRIIINDDYTAILPQVAQLINNL